jgi:hypothetical protein
MTLSVRVRYAYHLVAIAMLAGCGGSAGSVGLPSALGSAGDVAPHNKTFHYTGSPQLFKVPTGVNVIDVVARGAAGAGENCYSYCYGKTYFGRGGRVYAVIPAQSGEKLYVFVGGKGSRGSGGFNGGASAGSGGGAYGGGGASDVRQGGVALGDRILVAGGGGGQGGSRDAFGGGGGGAVAGNGVGGYGSSYSYSIGGGGGTGGSQTSGGFGGSGGESYEPGQPGASGDLGSGGIGGTGGCYYYSHGCGCGYADGCPGAGGGGGYYGGGGGGGGAGEYASIYGGPGGGGGGGSSYITKHAVKSRFWQAWKEATGDGQVVFTWQ